MPMRLAVPVLKRSNSKLTISSFGNADTNESVNDNGSMYRVDSMVFESVEIPRTTPPPAIRVSLATTVSCSSYDSRGSTMWRDSSVISLPQPSLTDEKEMGSPGKAHPLAPSAAPHNPMATPNSPYDLENSPQPVQKKNTLARTLFFLGFLFPLFWVLGGALIWRRTDYARTELTSSSSPTPHYHHSQTAIQAQGRYIQRVGQLQREKPTMNSSITSLSSNTTVFVHLPYQDDNWAWACLWAFALFLVAAAITLIALYANNII